MRNGTEGGRAVEHAPLAGPASLLVAEAADQRTTRFAVLVEMVVEVDRRPVGEEGRG
jgi:hypothetical protein